MKSTVIQYRVIIESKNILRDALTLERKLDSFGKDQWELCYILDRESSIVMIFKCEVKVASDAYYS